MLFSFSQVRSVITGKPLKLMYGDVIRGFHSDYKVIHVEKWKTEDGNMRVYHGMDLKRKRLVEIKIVPKGSVCPTELDKLYDASHADKEHFQQVYEYCHDRRYGSNLFVVVQLLNLSLNEFLQVRRPLSFCQIRVVMRQLFESLQILKENSIIHGDISLDGIKLVDPERCPLKVRLTDFSSYIPPTGSNMFLQASPSKSPEMMLGLPTNTPADTWSLGCVMANIYLGKNLFPWTCRYSWMRAVVKLLGQPDDYLLNHGINTEEFFIKDERRWRLKTPEEYEWTTGQPVIQEDCLANELTCLDDIRKFYKVSMKDKTEKREIWALVELLKTMLELDCHDRITPKQALRSQFLTMTHLKIETQRKKNLEMMRLYIPGCSSLPPLNGSMCYHQDDAASTSSDKSSDEDMSEHKTSIQLAVPLPADRVTHDSATTFSDNRGDEALSAHVTSKPGAICVPADNRSTFSEDSNNEVLSEHVTSKPDGLPVPTERVTYDDATSTFSEDSYGEVKCVTSKPGTVCVPADRVVRDNADDTSDDGLGTL